MILSYRKEAGLSIVELMIALLLASLLTLGLVQIFTSNSQTSRVNEASARVQESGRLASDIMARVIRNAAYWGCVSQSRLDSMLRDGQGFDVSRLMTGVMVEDDVAAGNTWGAVEGSDVLILGGVETNAALRTTEQTPVNSATIFTGSPSNPMDPRPFFDDGDIVIISDCRLGDIFQATQVRQNGFTVNTGNGSGNPGNARQNQNEYPAGASVFRPSSAAYYVREDADGNRAFVMNPLQVRGTGATMGTQLGAVELVNDVRDMRIRLGLRAGTEAPDNATVDSWVESLGAGDDEEDVIAVQFSLLARAPGNNVVDQPQSLCFPGWLDCETTPALRTTMPDNRLYREFTVTTGIRSRMP